MQPLYILFTSLSSLSLLSSVLSIECNNTQYKWPVKASRLCCNKCLPGQRLARRSKENCEIDCLPCPTDQYSGSYNTEFYCNNCDTCKEPLVLKSACNGTHNAVCECRPGYRCRDETCSQCVPAAAATTKPTPAPPGTTATSHLLTTSQRPYKPVRDTMWFLIIIALLCAGVALAVATKVKAFLQWIRSKHGYFLAEKPAVAQCVEDEAVSKPVQEVCGKCDQPIDV